MEKLLERKAEIENVLNMFTKDGYTSNKIEALKYELTQINNKLNAPLEYPIGTKFKSPGKHSRICTVVDILKTYNSKGELIQIRYVAEHEFLGQKVTDRDVLAVRIARGLINE